MTIQLPLLSYPFDKGMNPHTERADEQTFQWGRRFGIFDDPERFYTAHIGRLAGHTSPLSDPQGLQILADWETWLFAFDDAYCDETAAHDLREPLARSMCRYLRVIESPQKADPEDDSFAVALGELSIRIQQRATPSQYARFTHKVTSYFLAQCWEEVFNKAATLPDVPQYIHMRRHGGALPTCTALIDIVDGFVVSPEEFFSPAATSLSSRATNVINWSNDILSHPKERQRSTVLHSLPTVLSNQLGISTQAAIDESASMHDQEVFEYLEEEPAVRKAGSPQLCRYLDGLRYWMSGNLTWSLETGRYFVTDDYIRVQ